MTTEMVRFNVYLIYPFTPEIEKLLLKTIKQKRYRAEHEGRLLGEDEFTSTFREHLKEMGIDFIPIDRFFTVGRKSVNNIRIQVSKTKERRKTKQLIIRIPAMSSDEAIDKKRALMNYIEEQTGIRGEEASTTHQVVC